MLKPICSRILLHLISTSLFALPDAREKIPLYFSYITTLTGDFVASGGIPIIDKALQQINSRSDILENYTLNYTSILDSQCSSSPALESFFHHFNNASQPTYISLLCCGCSTATIPVADISHHWNVPHVAYAAAASVLKDRERFKTFFRALPSYDFYPSTFAQLMRQFGWRQLVVITQQESLFTLMVNSLQMIFDKEGWTLGQVQLESGLMEFPYDTVFNEILTGNYRLIVLNSYGEYVIRVLCEAYYRSMRYPQYIYFIHAGLADNFWEEFPETNSSCLHSVIAEMIDSSSVTISTNGYFPEPLILNTTSGAKTDTFIDEYLGLLQLPQYKQYPELAFVGVAYDSMWSIALGLDKASKRITAGNDSGCSHLPGDMVPLEMFDYFNERVGCILKQSMDEITFTGVIGDFDYVGGRRPDNIYLVHQERLRSNSVRKVVVAEVANYENESIFTFLQGESENTMWGINGAPYDGASVKTLVRNSLPLQVIYYILGSAGLVFAVTCLVFNIAFRNKKVVKLASPNLNYIIIAGSVLLYSCVFIYVFSVKTLSDRDAFTVLCNVREWMFSLGYTACFAVILSKQWRIYYIFNNPNMKKKIIKDWILLLVIISIMAIDLAIAVIGTAKPDTRLQANEVPSEKEYSTSDEGIRQENFAFICYRRSSYIWLFVSFIYKGSLQVVAIFMAFHTRKVKVKALNDSKEITAIIYINSIILTLLTVTEFALRRYHNVYAALFGLALLIEGTLFLGLVFVPKMVNLYVDPNGDKIFTTSLNMYQEQQKNSNVMAVCAKIKDSEHQSSVVNTDVNKDSTTNIDSIVLALNTRIKHLESQLKSMKKDESVQINPTLFHL